MDPADIEFVENQRWLGNPTKLSLQGFSGDHVVIGHIPMSSSSSSDSQSSCESSMHSFETPEALKTLRSNRTQTQYKEAHKYVARQWMRQVEEYSNAHEAHMKISLRLNRKEYQDCIAIKVMKEVEQDLEAKKYKCTLEDKVQCDFIGLYVQLSDDQTKQVDSNSDPKTIFAIGNVLSPYSDGKKRYDDFLNSSFY